MLMIVPQLFSADKIDSTFIKKSEFKFAIRPFFKTDIFQLIENYDNDSEGKNYLSNFPLVLGFGLSINNSIINFSYGYGLDILKNQGNVKTESFDFQYHKYARNYVFDLYLQKYKGFYLEDNPSTVFPDLDVRQYGIHWSYLFNNRKYSYKAIFNHDETQLKSVGSFLAGVSINRLEIKSDSIEVFGAHNLIRSTQFGINGGYAYNWVMNRNWILGFSINAGINLGYENIHNESRKKFRLYQTVIPRLSVAYSKNDWAMGFNYFGNLLIPISSKQPVLGLNSSSVSFYFIKRFNFIPFWNK